MTSMIKHDVAGSVTICSNQIIAQPTEIINVGSMALQKANYVDESFSFVATVASIKEELLLNQVSIDANLEFNTKYICQIRDIVNKLPKITEIRRQKLIIPEFDEIEVLKTDSVEIKKFIRKVNYEMLGFSCNHRQFDKKYNLVATNIADIFKSESFKIYDEFMTSMAKCIWGIRHADKYKKKWEDTALMPLGCEIDKIINSLVEINGKIASINAESNPTCSRCKAACKRCEYSVKEVERMRTELIEQNQIIEEQNNTPAEQKFDMMSFMTKNYPTATKFELSDVKERYKSTFKINATMTELTTLINNTKVFKITNVHGVKWVNRL